MEEKQARKKKKKNVTRKLLLLPLRSVERWAASMQEARARAQSGSGRRRDFSGG